MSSHATSDTPPLRVVILSTYYFPVLGGVESHARSLAAILKDRGADVWVLTKRMSAETPDREVVDDVPVVRVGPRGPRRGGAKWLMIPALVRALVRWRNRYDVVVCPDFRGVGLAALFARMPIRGLTGEQVDWLKRERAIYLLRSGRLCVAGLSERTLAPVVEAMAALPR